ncbi:MAG: hypothetical protein ACRC68_04935 [Clostridium sp.]
MKELTAKEIWELTKQHASYPILSYIMAILFFIFAVISPLFWVIFIFYLWFGYIESGGYFIDLIIKETKSIEGDVKLGGDLSFGKASIGDEIIVQPLEGKKVTLKYYNTIYDSVYELEKEKMKRYEKYRKVYHYLKLSKVIVYVELIPIEVIKKVNRNNKQKNKHKNKR